MIKKVSKYFKTVGKFMGRKHHIEFVTAALSIPVLLTVILLNVNSLKGNKSQEKSTPTPGTIIIREGGNSNNTQPTPTDSPLCRREVGPISISSPKEGASITDNPVNFIIKHDEEYCSVVWSYRINGGNWSEFSSNSPSVFNLPNGNVKFELRIQSTVSNDQDQIERNFIYQSLLVTPTPTTALSPTPTP